MAVQERREGGKRVHVPACCEQSACPLPAHRLALGRAGPRLHCPEEPLLRTPTASGGGGAPAGSRRALPGRGGAGAGAADEGWRERLSPSPGPGRRARAGICARVCDTRELLIPPGLPLLQLPVLLWHAEAWR